MEAELGCPLFFRTNRGVLLTQEGEELYRHVRVAFAEIEAGEAFVTQSRNLEHGSVALAASEGALRCLLLPVLQRFQAQHPGVRLRVSNFSTPQALAAIRRCCPSAPATTDVAGFRRAPRRRTCPTTGRAVKWRCFFVHCFWLKKRPVYAFCLACQRSGSSPVKCSAQGTCQHPLARYPLTCRSPRPARWKYISHRAEIFHTG